jgi:FMN phosphatase YigB (HAD superfamily)
MLDSWNDGATKSAILEFIHSVTTPGDSYVSPAERIATFDNDGTLWCEKPNYVQADFLLRRLGEMAEEDPARRTRQPWKALYERDHTWLAGLMTHMAELTAGVTEAFEGITTEAFEVKVREFFDTTSHPTLGVPYTEVAYRPMIELLDLLRANDFHVYICSAGGRDFVRVVSEEMYGVARDHVIGSASTLEYRDGDIYRTRGLEVPIDEGPGKPVHIWKRTGRKPLFACGNADGDAQMLETANFSLLIHHDDAEREFSYDDGAEKALAEAAERGWTVASMKSDFREIFQST